MNKPKKLILTTLFFILAASVATFAQDRVITVSEIPEAIHTYIKTHFPNQTIVKAEIDVEWTKEEYEIKLNDRTELEFDSKFQIKKIDGKGELPSTVIPLEISNYVKANYPDNVITDWELNRKHQEVELNNGLELEFTLEGEFIRIDR